MAIRILQDKTGNKIYSVYINGYDNKGKRLQKRRNGIKSHQIAKEVEFELKRQLYNTKDQKPEYTFGEWYEKCMGIMKVELKNSTIVNYRTSLEKWVVPHWKDHLLKNITPSDVHDLIFVKLSQELSSHTRGSILRRLKRLFNMALEDGVAITNPSLKIKIKIPDVKQLVLNSNEIEILLREAKIQKHRFYEIWVLAILTGMRSGELFALTWTDVDFESKFIHVTKSWGSLNGIGPTKNSKNRLVPISPESMRFLKELKLKTGSCDSVLPQHWEWAKGCQAHILKNFCRSVGITAVKFHDLRATFITQLLGKGVPVAKVMAIVGHADLKTTQGYLRLAGLELAGATDSLGVEIPSGTPAKVLDFPSKTLIATSFYSLDN